MSKENRNGRIYDTDKLKEEFNKLVDKYRLRTDLDIPHPNKLKWYQRFKITR